MEVTFTVMLEEDLNKRFEMALQLSGETKEAAISAMLRTYVSRTFAQAAAAYDQPATHSFAREEGSHYGKAIHRIPKWAKKPTQINHKIIKAFLQLAENGAVTYSALLSRCSDEEHFPDVYVPTFASNFAQMKFDGDKSHGKVFDVDADNIVTIWKPVEATLMDYKDSFSLRTTDIGYLNRNRQRNMGKTKAHGTDHLQYLYLMRCEDCDHQYFANGSDIFQKKCPACQGGADTGT